MITGQRPLPTKAEHGDVSLSNFFYSQSPASAGKAALHVLGGLTVGQEQAPCPLHRPGCSAHPRARQLAGEPRQHLPGPGPSVCTHSTHCSQAAQGFPLGRAQKCSPSSHSRLCVAVPLGLRTQSACSRNPSLLGLCISHANPLMTFPM